MFKSLMFIMFLFSLSCSPVSLLHALASLLLLTVFDLLTCIHHGVGVDAALEIRGVHYYHLVRAPAG